MLSKVLCFEHAGHVAGAHYVHSLLHQLAADSSPEHILILLTLRGTAQQDIGRKGPAS
jgi:hypothetical protein